MKRIAAVSLYSVVLMFSCDHIPTGPIDVQNEIDNSIAEVASTEPTFKKYFGGPGFELSACVIKTNDGGYALSGISEEHFYLVKTDRNGNLKWEKIFGESGVQKIPGCVCQAHDGGYLLSGAEYSNTKVIVYKTDENGNLQWEKKYTSLNTHGLVRMTRSHDNGYVGVAGVTFFKLNTTGDLVWTSQYDTTNYLMSIERTKDNGFIAAANHVIIKISSGGTLQWKKINSVGEYTHTIQTKDGGYVSVGYQMTGYDDDIMEYIYEIILLKTDSSGRYKWKKGYYPSDSPMGYRVQETPDKGFAVLGFHSLENVLLKVNSTGTPQWRKIIGYNILQNDYFDLVIASDGGIVVSSALGDQAALVKFDKNGNL